MKYEHTPGPWEVDCGMVQTMCTCPSIDHSECETKPIAWMDTTCGNGTNPSERDQNAKLIAAAPELLAACENLFKSPPHPTQTYHPHTANAWEQVRRAVEKARRQ